MKALLMTGIAIILIGGSSPARAGVYTDDLSRCLVSSTTEADRAQLIKWIFSALALQKEISSFVNMPSNIRARINQDTAGLFMRLVTVSCRSQMHDANKYEGPTAINAAFSVLGQVASQGLFSDPAVVAGMADMDKYFDRKKLNAVLERK